MDERALRVLYVEDVEDDCLLVVRLLEQSGLGLTWKRVATREAFSEAIAQDAWDVILCDHSLPGFNSFDAQALLSVCGLDIPFIIVSGTIGEEQAVECMRAGAHDYVLKDNLRRLVPAINREVREAENRRRQRSAEEALKRSEEQFRHAQKMEAVGRLAGGVIHDFNNLLTAILGFSHLALERVDDPGLRSDLEQVIVTADRAARLTSQLLAFSRQQVQAPKLIDIAQVLSGLEPMLRCLVGDEVVLATDYAPGLDPVFMDSGQLEQLVMNLAVNARDAMTEHGRLTLRTRGQRSGRAHGAPDQVVLEVSDSGTGMDAETLGRVFEPFFTTKESGRGTGLGLSTVYGIVQQSGGSIAVQSDLGTGTSFFVTLPVAPMRAAAEAAEIPTPIVHGSETVLVVDDEPSVRAVLVAVLRSGGYHVIEAPDATIALGYGLDLREPLDLLVTDIAMPEISGRELARQLLAARRDLRVLYLSGYGMPISPRGGHASDSSFLQKPFAPSRLLAKIRERLDAPAGERG